MNPELNPIVLISLSYIALYYVLMVNVLRAKLKAMADSRARGESFDRYRSEDPYLRAADRIQLNTLEHMPPFLTLLWLDALFGDPSFAAILGWVYLALRVTYPFFMGPTLGKNVPYRLLFNTFSGYFVLAALLINTAMGIC